MSQREDDQHTNDQWAYHMGAISQLLEQWRHGDLTTWQKRKAIADENARYYQTQAQPWMTRTGRRYEAPAVLAEAAGVDEEVMLIALNMYQTDGREAYQDVIKSALGR